MFKSFKIDDFDGNGGLIILIGTLENRTREAFANQVRSKETIMLDGLGYIQMILAHYLECR